MLFPVASAFFPTLMLCFRDYSVISVPNWRMQACRIFPSLLEEGSHVSVTCTFLILNGFLFFSEKHFCGIPNCSLFYDDVTLKKRAFWYCSGNKHKALCHGHVTITSDSRASS